MNHAITIGGLLLTLGVIAGFVALCFGGLEIMAGGMSDAPEEGNATAKSGCVFLVIGAVLLVGCIIGLVR